MSTDSFFADFLLITNVKTVLFILVLVALFAVIRVLEKKKVKFSTRTIVATVLGLLLGVVIQLIAGMPGNPSEVPWLHEVSKWYGFVGSGFMDLLKMLVVPMVFLSILRVIINMGDNDNIGKLTTRSVGMLLITTAFSALVGIVVGNLMNLGSGIENTITDSKMKEVQPFIDTIRGLLPSNPVSAMAEGNVVAVIIFACFLGIAVRRLNKKYAEIIKPFVDFMEAFYRIIVSVAMTVIKFMPYAIIAMFATTLINKGLASILSVLEFIGALYISVLIVFIAHLIIVSICGLNPIKYVKNAAQALILAFTSRSSLGTLPVTIETLTKNQGVDEGVASFTASLGANMGMNGCAGIYPALMAVTLANITGIQTDFTFYAMLIVVIAISSLGIAGLPGTATMSVSVVISGIGLGAYFPLLGGIIAIDPILDMGRTMLNVNGASTSTIAVAKSMNKIDKNVFNS